MIGAPLWIPAFAGMTKKDQSPRSHRFLPFPQNAPAIPAKRSPPFPQNALHHSRKTLAAIPAKRFPSFPQNTPCHSRKTLPAIPAKHSPSFPRRQESIEHHSDPHWGSLLESTESSMPAHFFRRFYVERSVGFVGYDVDRGCFMTGAPLWIPAFAGMTKKDQSPRSHRFPPFPQNALRHSRKTLPAIPAKHSPSFPRRRESIEHHSDPLGFSS